MTLVQNIQTDDQSQSPTIPRLPRDQQLCNSLSLASSLLRHARLGRYVLHQLQSRGERERAQVGASIGRTASVSQRETADHLRFPGPGNHEHQFGIDTKSEDFAHKKDMGKAQHVWKQARITCDTKDRVDAVKRAYGEPVSFLTVDWTSLLREL